ncbi:helix-turn-helix domain-containing protein [Paraburkholderia hospita]|nr:helix-turn-helix domain-containing protein [Paraburkholderia hospita]
MARTFDIDECADFLKVDRNTALKLAQQGDLPGAKIGRAWVFLEDDVVEYLRVQVRHQMVERQNNASIDRQLEAAKARHPPTPISPKRRVRGSVPQLPPLPDGVTAGKGE